MRARRTLLTLTSAVLAAAGLLLTPASPASAGFETYSAPNISRPIGMAAAPDGTLWFTNFGSNTIGQVDPTTGAVTTYLGPTISDPTGITVAPDGVVWFANSGTGTLGKVEGGVVSAIDVAMEGIDDVEVAVNGDIWFNGFHDGDDFLIGRFRPSTNFATAYPVPGRVGAMTPHPTDGMWFVWFNAATTIARVRHITEAGDLSGVALGPVHDPTDITTGPDGRLWLTAEDQDLIARLNPATGAIATFTQAQVRVPNEIISGPDGDLWFTIRSGGRLGRIDPATGAIVTYQDPTDRVEGPIGLAEGGDGTVWYTRIVDGTADRVGHLVLPTCDGREVTVDLALGSRPTGAADVIRGTNKSNTIAAGAGNDVICSLGGNDMVDGEAGRDRLFGGPGSDLLDGGGAVDRCDGGRGTDVAVACETRIRIP